MRIVDAHTHLRTGKLSGIPTPASAEMALQLLQEDMERAEVTTSLVVTWPEDVPALAQEAASSPGKLYSLLWFDSRRPDRSLVEGLQLHEAQLNLPPQVLPYLLQRRGSAKLMFGSDRIGREEKFFRRIQFIRSIPPLYRDDLCQQTATRVYGLQG